METQRQNNLKHFLVIGITCAFLFPATVQAHNGATMFGIYKHHHYVYYPKQNFYYDPFACNYVVVENGVWIRQVTPPRLFTRINVNVLPHVDVYVDSYYPYEDNNRHKHTYRVVRYMTPESSFYAFKLPVRYDFSITAYQYYEPRPHIVFVDYNPNYYRHPHHGHGRGHAYGHYKHHDMAWNDHHDYGHYPHHNDHKPFGHHPKPNNGSGNHHPGDFHKPTSSQNNSRHPGDFHKPTNGKDNGRRPGDFHQSNGTQNSGRYPGDFHKEKGNDLKKGNDHKEQRNNHQEQRPATVRNPGDFHHQNDPERKQEKPQLERKPGDFHSKGNRPESPAKGPRRK